jgi:hypothetical protein
VFHFDIACDSSGYCMCFIWTLQCLYTYVASEYFKGFICFRRMLQVFYLDVAYVLVAIYIYCKHLFKIFHLFYIMLQVFSPDVAYVVNVSPVSEICCRSASCCSISRRRKRTQETIPTGAASEAGVGGPHLHAYQQARCPQLYT